MTDSIVFDSVARGAFSEAVVKSHATARAASVPEKRLTLAPIYMPDSLDAHNEFASADAIEEAIIDFAKNGTRRLNLQHGDLGYHTVGDILSVFVWPYEATCEMTDPRTLKKTLHTFPAGTAWMWVRWDKDSWPLVKAGKLTGYSMGGTAKRVLDPSGAGLPNMGYDVRKVFDFCIDLLRREPRNDNERFVKDRIAPAPHGGVLYADEELQQVLHLSENGIEVYGVTGDDDR